MPIAKILIVEDEGMVARDIKQSLERLGFSIAGIADNSKDAIRLTSETKPDAILMDIVLKGSIDGIETARVINEQFNIPVIYLTAHQDKHTIDKSKTTKPYGYILKPLNDRDLNACLRMALYRFDTEKKLRESEERYFRLSENARDMIFRISLVSGVYEYVNKASLDLTGYSPKEFYSSPMLIEKIIHPDWKDYFQLQWESLKAGDMPDVYEFQIINKSGEERWLNQRNVLIKNSSGVPIALEGIATDVTDRKNTEALIRKQSEEYRLILDSMPAAVLVKDHNNRLIRVNKPAALKKGVTAKDMEGRYSEEFYSEQSQEDIKAEREIMLSGKPMLNSIEIFTNGTSEKKWAKVDRFPYRNENGEITGIIVFSQDITEQKKAEDELKKIEVKNAAILGALPDLIFIMDAEGRVLEYKANDIKALTVPPSEFMGKKASEFMPENIANNIELNIKKAFETGKVQVYEYSREVKNQVKSFELRFAICGENEVLAIARDITERKQFDNILKESESRYRNLTDKAPICLTRLLVKERIYEFANAEFVRQSGFTLGEFNKLTDEQLNTLIYPEDREWVLGEYDKWAKNGCPGVKHITYRFTNRNGNLLWLDTYHYADYDSSGKIYAVNQIYIDITEQKKSEAALRLSEEKFRAVADTTHAVIFIYQDNKFVYGNSYAEVLTGFKLNELYKINFWDIVHPDFREDAKKRGYARQLGEEVPSRFEMKIITKTGEEKWIDFSASLFEFGGKPAVMGTAIDITESKKAAETVKASEEKYRNLSQNAPVAVTRLSFRENKYEFVNNEFVRQSGYNMEEINSLGDEDQAKLLHEEDRDRILMEYNDWVNGGCKDIKFMEYRVNNRYNNNMWLNTYLYAEFDSGGEPVTINQVCIDVTDRKEAAELVKASEEKFRAVAESMPVQVVIFQGDKFVYANPYTEILTGYSVEETLKMNFWDLVHPEVRETVKVTGIARQKGEDVPENYEIKIITRNNEEKWLFYSAKPVNYNGKIAILGTAIDITQRKHAEESLKESEERYRAFIEQSTEGIYRVELKRHIETDLPVERQIELIYEYAYMAECNKIMAQMYGAENPSGLIGKKMNEMLVATDPNNYEYLKRFILNKYKITDDESHETDVSGNSVYFSNNAVGIIEDGKLVRMWGTHRDITARKKTEEKIKENAEYSRIINYFTASMLQQNTIEEILWDVSKNCFSSLSFVDCVIYLVDEKDKMLIQKAAYGRKNPQGYEILNPANVHIGEGIAGAVALSGIPEIVSDTTKDDRYIVDDEVRLSEIAVPIISEGKVIGVIDSEHPQKGFFTEFHLNILMSIASLCSNKIVRALAEDKIKQSEIKYKTLVDGMNEGVVYTDNNEVIQFVNDQFCKIVGYSREELLGKVASSLMLDEEGKKILKTKIEQRQNGVSERYEVQMVRKSGERRWIYISGSPVVDNSDRVIGSVGTHADITERKLAEEQLRKSLVEKEILLKEIHHRVKNNLQIVSSLLKLQATYIKDKASLDLFKESQNRVQSMALIHQKLYQAKDLTNVNFGEYAGSLISYLMQTFGITKELVEVSINPEKVYMSIDNAIPAGLIVNELVTNSIKHGFPKNSPGKININISFNENAKEYKLIVRDNGIGIPDGFNIYSSPSFGLKLVTTLTEQMKGSINFINDNGTEFTVIMKNADYTERS